MEGDDAGSAGRVAGKIALISGAGRGMGRSHAVRLAEEGADVILVDICASVEGVRYAMSLPEDLDVTAQMVRDKGRQAVTAIADVRDRTSLRDAVDRGVAELGGRMSSLRTPAY